MMRLLLLPGVLVACQSAPATTPASVVDSFYAASIASGRSGAPSPEELAVLAPYLSDSLKALLVAARGLYEAARVQAPGDKPPFADGSLFSSLFEGPTAVSVVGDTARGATHAVTIRMTYAGADPPVIWTDQVLVVREHGRFVIEDVVYGGDWDFANKGTLRSALAAALINP
jgi:hypothetical protein